MYDLGENARATFAGAEQRYATLRQAKVANLEDNNFFLATSTRAVPCPSSSSGPTASSSTSTPRNDDALGAAVTFARLAISRIHRA